MTSSPMRARREGEWLAKNCAKGGENTGWEGQRRGREEKANAPCGPDCLAVGSLTGSAALRVA